VEKVGAFTDRVTAEGEWRSGNPATNEQATPLLSPYFNMLQRELLQVLEIAGIAPDEEDDGQIAAAIAELLRQHAVSRNHPMATTGDRGMVRFATAAEHLAAASNDRATTPAGVKSIVQRFLAPRVSLIGPSLVYPGSTNTYTITDYSDFSTYAVSASQGTVTRSGDTLTLVLDAGAPAGSLDLTVTRDGLDVVNQVAVGEQTIARPSLVYPGDGDTDVDLQPALQSSAFATYLVGADVHVSSDWQIATDAAFLNIVASATADQENLTSWTPSEPLPIDTTLYARMRQTGNSLGQTDWTPVVSFTTTNQYIVTPTITSPADGATDVPEQPVIESSVFATSPAGADTHVSTSWRLRDGGGAVVWESLNDASNLTSITIPEGVLSEGQVSYTIEVQYHGTTLPDSGWSAQVGFTTSDSFIPEGQPGAAFGGGFYTATMYDESGNRYALVTAPKAEGEASGTMTWQEAINYCNGLTIGGHSDWQLATIDERRMEYRAYKPTTNGNVTDHGATDRVDPPLGDYTSGDPSQTSIAEFQDGGSEAFIAFSYWTATELSSSNARYVHFSNGNEGNYSKTNTLYVRAVRRVYF